LLAEIGSQSAGTPHYYPPGQTGLRGSHVGSFEVAHQLAREKRTDWGPAEDADGMVYDLVVVGAGVSGLTAAHFYQKEHPDATILILDNHDDFGGHAKRNEFSYGGQKHIGYGGSQSILDPGGFSRVAKRLLEDLTIDVDRFDTAFDQNFNKRFGLSKGIYFDRKTYGVDRVVKGTLLRWNSYSTMEESQVFAEEAIPNMPISEEAKPGIMLPAKATLAPSMKSRRVILRSIPSSRSLVFDTLRIRVTCGDLRWGLYYWINTMVEKWPR